jgi:RHS repeat-associated protein
VYEYTGRQFDDESGNYYYRTRMHSPQIGRFLKKDMRFLLTMVSKNARFQDADATRVMLNLYLFMNDNPVNGEDPFGFVQTLQSLDPITALYWYMFGKGEEVSIAFDSIDTSDIMPRSFSKVEAETKKKGNREVEITDMKDPYFTRGLTQAFLGRIRLRAEGTFLVTEECLWSFEGKLTADGDWYDFNPDKQRPLLAEMSVHIGGKIPGQRYFIGIRGSKKLSDNGKTERK